MLQYLVLILGCALKYQRFTCYLYIHAIIIQNDIKKKKLQVFSRILSLLLLFQVPSKPSSYVGNVMKALESTLDGFPPDQPKLWNSRVIVRGTQAYTTYAMPT